MNMFSNDLANHDPEIFINEWLILEIINFEEEI